MSVELSTLQGHLGESLREGGVFGVFVAIVVAALVSEDLTSIAAGLLVSAGRLPLGPALAACFAGIFLGDTLLYLAGRGVGRPLVCRLPFRPDAVKLLRARERLRANAGAVLFGSRFVPVARLPVYLAAGMLRIPSGIFFSRVLPAGLIWTPLIVLGADRLGRFFVHFI